MLYTKKNITQIEEIYWHDYEMISVEVSYFQKSLKIGLKSSQGKKAFIKTKRLYHLIVEGNEPWGEGIYIHELKKIVEEKNTQIVFNDREVFGIYILMNSGDKIILYANEMEYQEV